MRVQCRVTWNVYVIICERAYKWERKIEFSSWVFTSWKITSRIVSFVYSLSLIFHLTPSSSSSVYTHHHVKIYFQTHHNFPFSSSSFFSFFANENYFYSFHSFVSGAYCCTMSTARLLEENHLYYFSFLYISPFIFSCVYLLTNF